MGTHDDDGTSRYFLNGDGTVRYYIDKDGTVRLPVTEEQEREDLQRMVERSRAGWSEAKVALGAFVFGFIFATVLFYH